MKHDAWHLKFLKITVINIVSFKRCKIKEKNKWNHCLINWVYFYSLGRIYSLIKDFNMKISCWTDHFDQVKLKLISSWNSNEITTSLESTNLIKFPSTLKLISFNHMCNFISFSNLEFFIMIAWGTNNFDNWSKFSKKLLKNKNFFWCYH